MMPALRSPHTVWMQPAPAPTVGTRRFADPRSRQATMSEPLLLDEFPADLEPADGLTADRGAGRAGTARALAPRRHAWRRPRAKALGRLNGSC